MGENFVTAGRIVWLAAVSLLVMIVNVAISVLYMVVYGHVIDPGHEQAYYDAHIQAAAPYSSIIAGIPLMFLAGWWVGRWWQGKFAIKSAFVIWLIYAVIDVTLMLASGMTASLAVLVAISVLTKLAAACLGAYFSKARQPA